MATSPNLIAAGLSLVGVSALKVRVTSVEEPAWRWPMAGKKVRLGWMAGHLKRKCLEEDCSVCVCVCVCCDIYIYIYI